MEWGGGGWFKSWRNFGLVKNCKLLVIRDLQAFNGQSFIIFIVSFIMHTNFFCFDKYIFFQICMEVETKIFYDSIHFHYTTILAPT